MTLTPGQRRSWARHGAREIDRTITEAKAAIAAEEAARLAAWKAAPRQHKLPAVMPHVLPGDRIVLVTGNTVVVRRVNAKSVTTTTGTRYGAAEIDSVIPRQP
jgi:hypothetical protein